MNKNRICLILKNNSGWTGGTEYIKNILASFSYLDNFDRKNVELHLISFDSSSNNLEKDCDFLHEYRNQRNPFIRYIFSTKKNNKLKEFIFTLFILYKYKINFIFPFPKYSFCIGLKTALWIPDFQHHYLSKFFSKKEIFHRNRKFRKIFNNSSVLVLSSEDCRKDLKKFYGERKSKIFILNFRANLKKDLLKKNPNDILNKYKLPQKFFIISNQFWRHKNHLLVFKSLSYLKNKYHIRPNLVLTGKLIYDDSAFAREIIDYIKNLEINSQIYILGLIPKEDQFLLMRQSLAIIQPSLFEGWSTIVEEARSIGKTIILSDLDVHKEQNFSKSIFFKRDSYKDLSSKLLNTYKDLNPGPNLDDEKKFSLQHDNLMKAFANKFISLSNLN